MALPDFPLFGCRYFPDVRRVFGQIALDYSDCELRVRLSDRSSDLRSRKTLLGPLTASLAAWLWVILPFAWWTPIQDIWDTALTGFLLTSILWGTFAIRESARPTHWFGYGFLWALATLVNPAVLSVLPFFVIWIWSVWAVRSPRLSMRLPSAALLTCALLLLPWTVRNHHVLGRWIPLRSNFGLELWLGNNPDPGDVNSFALHPLWNHSEAAEFQRMGEIAYVSDKEHEALEYVRSHPASTLRSVLGRVWFYWFAVTDRPDAHWSTSPAYVKILFVANLFMILLSGMAAIIAFRKSEAGAFPYLIVLTVFPLPYYLTHTLVRYRFPIEPVLSILSVYGLLWMLAWFNYDRTDIDEYVPGKTV